MKANLPKLDGFLAWFISIILVVSIAVGINILVDRSRAANQSKIEEMAKSQLAIEEKNLEQLRQKWNDAASLPQPETPSAPIRRIRSERYGYAGDIAPARWADLNPDWELCKTGKNQSPINFNSAKSSSDLKGLRFHYLEDVAQVSLEHQTVVLTWPEGSWFEYNSERYDLKFTKIRTPSEHQQSGLYFDAELQFHHRSLTGSPLILSVFLLKQAASNALIQRLVTSLPSDPSEQKVLVRANPTAFLPDKRTYWTYQGSLTYPPCSEGYTWVMLTQASTISQMDLESLIKVQGKNIRPLQQESSNQVRRSNR
jgi:carbonic anhydrase